MFIVWSVDNQIIALYTFGVVPELFNFQKISHFESNLQIAYLPSAHVKNDCISGKSVEKQCKHSSSKNPIFEKFE